MQRRRERETGRETKSDSKQRERERDGMKRGEITESKSFAYPRSSHVNLGQEVRKHFRV